MQKPFLLLILLLLVQGLDAQNINIPDEKLKQVLIGAEVADLDGDGEFDGPVDTNNDNEISQTEAEAVIGLRIISFDIVDPEGLQFFTNLTFLRLGNNDIKAFDLSPFTLLESFDCSSNEISELDFSNNLALTELDCSGNNFEAIDVSMLRDLRVLDLGGNMISNLNLDANKNLEKIVLGANEFDKLVINGFPNLTELSILPNELDKLEISNNSSLQELKFRGRFGRNEKLLDVKITDNENLQSVIFELIELRRLDLSNNDITILEHEYVSTLEYFDISNNTSFSKPFFYRPVLDSINIENTALRNVQILGDVEFFNFNTNVPITVSLLDLENNSLSIVDQTSIQELNIRFENESTIHDVQFENLPLLKELKIRGKVNSLNLIDFPNLNVIEVDALSIILNNVGLKNLGSPNFITNDFLVSENLVIEDCDSLTSIYYRGTTQNVTFKSLDNLNAVGIEDAVISNFLMENSTTPDLRIMQSDITTAEIQDNQLNIMRVHSNNIINLFIENNTGLKMLDTRNAILNNINLVNNPDLVHYELNNHTTSEINLQGLDRLQTIIFDRVDIDSISLRNLPGLEVIEDKLNSNTQDLFLENLPRLRTLTALARNINPDDVHGLQLEGFPSLDSLFAIGRGEIRLCNLDKLRFIQLTPNDEDFVDLSSCPVLTDVTIGFIQADKKLSLANGANLITSLQVGTNIDTICVDNTQEQEQLSDFINHDVVFDLACSQDENGCGQIANSNFTISGNILLDTGLGCENIKEGFNYILPIAVESSTFSGNIYSDQLNSFIFTANASDTSIVLRPQIDTRYYSVEPEEIVLNISELEGDVEQHFCIWPTGDFTDIEVQLIPLNQIRPGQLSKHILRIRNIGSNVFTGPISLDFDGSVLNYQSATLEPMEINSTDLSWNIDALFPLSETEIEIEFELNKPSDTPPLVGEEVLQFVANAAVQTDQDSSNNTFILNQSVVNSLDPNDKTCLIGEELDFESRNDYLYYQIRFENIGTAEAIDVEITDEIDTSLFDISSFRPVTESHQAKVSLNDNIIRYQFKDINLPFAEGENQGYILFKIKAKSSVTFGDRLDNYADIVFDFNDGIKTNTYSTLIVDISSNTSETLATDKIDIVPNPVHKGENLTIDLPIQGVYKLSIYTPNGKLVHSSMVDSSILYPTHELNEGLYILTIQNKSKRYVQKLVVIK